MLGGRIPVNPSGGVLAKGEPVGASALGQVYEIVRQLRGLCGPRQVGGARTGDASAGRTDPDAPAHKGISCLLVDMSSPGVTVSPLVMSTGDAEFGEVFFDDVLVRRGRRRPTPHG